MSALEGKSIPILTLDNKWHQLFTQTEMTPEIEALADELNALVEKDGKLRSENKDIKRLKKKLGYKPVVLGFRGIRIKRVGLIKKQSYG